MLCADQPWWFFRGQAKCSSFSPGVGWADCQQPVGVLARLELVLRQLQPQRLVIAPAPAEYTTVIQHAQGDDARRVARELPDARAAPPEPDVRVARPAHESVVGQLRQAPHEVRVTDARTDALRALPDPNRVIVRPTRQRAVG